jgi:hypothetical protein
MNTLLNYLLYQIGIPNNEESYIRMRNDYIYSKKEIINKVCRINEFVNPKYKIKQSCGVLGNLSNDEVNSICNEIDEQGYFIFPNKISQETISALKEYSLNMPVNYLIPDGENISYSKNTVKYIDNKFLSNRYQNLNISDLINCPEAIAISLDQNFLHIANNFLKSKPILDLIILWWSQNFENLNVSKSVKEQLKDSSAQMFHFDMDRLKFLKFFVYLTDVNTSTGPHVYVKKTNRKIPKYIRSDGRFNDEYIFEFDGENIVEINGAAGTIIAVDTRGLHKGKELESGERLIFQIEFTNSLFGNPSVPVLKEKLPFIAENKFFSSYKLFFKN